jgi:amino acid permease
LAPLTVNGIRHATLTLTSTALGGGVLSVSYVMKLSGLGLGVSMLLAGGFLSFLSITALMRMSIETGNETYAGLLSRCAGPRAGPILDSLLFIYGNGSCVGYFVFLGDFVPALVEFCAPHAPRWCASRWLAISVGALAVLPLAVQREVSALRYVSPVSICALMYMAIVVTAKAYGEHESHVNDPIYGEVELFHLDLHFSEAFALCVFAFNCHLNVVPVAASMVAPTKARITKVSYRVNALQLAFYCLIGVTGYLSFLEMTPQDILKGYPSSDSFVAGGRFLLTGTMLVAIPLNLNPTIKSALQIGDYLRGDVTTTSESRPAAPRVVLAVVCIACQAVLAINVPGVADVLSLLGATVATAMMMVLPAYCMGVIMPRTAKNRAQQAILIFFSLVSVASVPVKVLRMTNVLQ